MSTLLFYDNPVALSSKTHLNLRIKPSEDGLRFSGNTNSVLLAAIEFPEACRHFPIVFARGAEKQQVLPMALLGLRDRENLFVDADGRWTGEYVPAYIRRYPFVLARAQSGPQMTVCIDESYPGFGADEGEALFNAKGEATEHLTAILAFLKDYQLQLERTEVFLRNLVDNDLLMEVSANVNVPGGESYSLKGMWMVDERKLQALPEEKVLALFRAGELAWIYSHLISLANFRRLSGKAGATAAGAADPSAAGAASTATSASEKSAAAAKAARKK